MSMSELVQRYLPATLLMRMIRPVFVSRYVERRDFGQLNAFANLVLKLNVLVLAPLLGFVAVCGNEASAIVSAGRYMDVGWILFGVVLLLFPTSHQIVVSILANTLEENDIQIKSALVGLSGVLVAWMLIPSYGAYGALTASIASAVSYNATSALLLRRRGYAYRVDSKGLARLFGAAAAGAIPAWALARGVDGLFGLIVAGAALLVVYVAVASRYRAFSADERDMINRLLPKPVFFF
jgi:O-antigen/teichoic acid export membrane protein